MADKKKANGGRKPKSRQEILLEQEQEKLLAEEKWIVKTLKKIREHKKNLQLEYVELCKIRERIVKENLETEGESATDTIEEAVEPKPSASSMSAPCANEPGPSNSGDKLMLTKSEPMAIDELRDDIIVKEETMSDDE